MAVVNALPRLRELYDLCFFEDLHYASSENHRNAGLLFFSGLLKGHQLTRRIIALTPELLARKMKLVGIYSSQYKGKPRALDFTPATTGIRQLHAAVWVLSR